MSMLLERFRVQPDSMADGLGVWVSRRPLAKFSHGAFLTIKPILFPFPGPGKGGGGGDNPNLEGSFEHSLTGINSHRLHPGGRPRIVRTYSVSISLRWYTDTRRQGAERKIRPLGLGIPRGDLKNPLELNNFLHDNRLRGRHRPRRVTVAQDAGTERVFTDIDSI